MNRGVTGPGGRWQPVLCLLIVGAAGFAGCKAVPLQRTMNTSAVAAGPDTVEAIRRQLEGKWTMVSLTVTNAAGRLAKVPATGELSLDSFGNLAVEYRVSDDGLKALAGVGITTPNPVISTTGRVVLDPQQRTIVYQSEKAETELLDPKLAALRANPFALERIRYYTLGEDGLLTLATRHDSGRDAAVSRWKKG